MVFWGLPPKTVPQTRSLIFHDLSEPGEMVLALSNLHGLSREITAGREGAFFH